MMRDSSSEKSSDTEEIIRRAQTTLSNIRNMTKTSHSYVNSVYNNYAPSIHGKDMLDSSMFVHHNPVSDSMDRLAQNSGSMRRMEDIHRQLGNQPSVPVKVANEKENIDNLSRRKPQKENEPLSIHGIRKLPASWYTADHEEQPSVVNSHKKPRPNTSTNNTNNNNNNNSKNTLVKQITDQVVLAVRDTLKLQEKSVERVKLVKHIGVNTDISGFPRFLIDELLTPQEEESTRKEDTRRHSNSTATPAHQTRKELLQREQQATRQIYEQQQSTMMHIPTHISSVQSMNNVTSALQHHHITQQNMHHIPYASPLLPSYYETAPKQVLPMYKDKKNARTSKKSTKVLAKNSVKNVTKSNSNNNNSKKHLVHATHTTEDDSDDSDDNVHTDIDDSNHMNTNNTNSMSNNMNQNSMNSNTEEQETAYSSDESNDNDTSTTDTKSKHSVAPALLYPKEASLLLSSPPAPIRTSSHEYHTSNTQEDTEFVGNLAPSAEKKLKISTSNYLDLFDDAFDTVVDFHSVGSTVTNGSSTMKNTKTSTTSIQQDVSNQPNQRKTSTSVIQDISAFLALPGSKRISSSAPQDVSHASLTSPSTTTEESALNTSSSSSDTHPVASTTPVSASFQRSYNTYTSSMQPIPRERHSTLHSTTPPSVRFQNSTYHPLNQSNSSDAPSSTHNNSIHTPTTPTQHPSPHHSGDQRLLTQARQPPPLPRRSSTVQSRVRTPHQIQNTLLPVRRRLALDSDDEDFYQPLVTPTNNTISNSNDNE